MQDVSNNIYQDGSEYQHQTPAEAPLLHQAPLSTTSNSNPFIDLRFRNDQPQSATMVTTPTPNRAIPIYAHKIISSQRQANQSAIGKQQGRNLANQIDVNRWTDNCIGIQGEENAS